MKRSMVQRFLAGLTICVAAQASSITDSANGSTESPYVQAVRQFADNVLTYGHDTYHHTPLLVDGINVDTHEPATWRLPAACSLAWNMPKRWVMCNVASQQNLFRTLDGLTTATGNPKYRQAAVDAMDYTFKHLSHRSGLLYWGGHCLVDLATLKPVGESHKDWLKIIPIPATWETGLVHELKQHYPYYELMWEIDPKATRKFIEAFWGTHIMKWSNLDMSRHGYISTGAGPGWDHEYTGGAVPFNGKGLSLLHAGTDLMYSATMLTLLSDDERPLTWAKRMAQRYADIRNPVTKLGPEIYAHYRHLRVLAQFGPEWDKRLTETTIASMYATRFSGGSLGLLKIAERLGPRGDIFKQLAVEDLTAFAKYAYDANENSFWALLTDGTKLTPEIVKRPGPFGAETFHKHSAGSTSFWAYALGACASNTPLLLDTARNIGRHLGLGDIGEVGPTAKTPPQLNLQTPCADPLMIFALLDLNRLTNRNEYLDLAHRIGDNLLAKEFHRGFFIPDDNYLYCNFDTISPLALLHLDAALNHSKTAMPFYMGGHSFFHCDFKGKGRSYDGLEIYAQRRVTPSTQPTSER